MKIPLLALDALFCTVALLLMIGHTAMWLIVDPQTLQLTYPTRHSDYHFIADNGSVVLTTQADMDLNDAGGVDEGTPFSPEFVSRVQWTMPGVIYRNRSFAAGILSGF